MHTPAPPPLPAVVCPLPQIAHVVADNARAAADHKHSSGGVRRAPKSTPWADGDSLDGGDDGAPQEQRRFEQPRFVQQVVAQSPLRKSKPKPKERQLSRAEQLRAQLRQGHKRGTTSRLRNTGPAVDARPPSRRQQQQPIVLSGPIAGDKAGLCDSLLLRVYGGSEQRQHEQDRTKSGGLSPARTAKADKARRQSMRAQQQQSLPSLKGAYGAANNGGAPGRGRRGRQGGGRAPTGMSAMAGASRQSQVAHSTYARAKQLEQMERVRRPG